MTPDSMSPSGEPAPPPGPERRAFRLSRGAGGTDSSPAPVHAPAPPPRSDVPGRPAPRPEPARPVPEPGERDRGHQGAGYERALNAMSDVAAPLLAAASVTMVSVILQASSSFPQGEPAVVALLLAAGLFVLSVQSSFYAKIYSGPDAAGPPARRDRWVNRSRRTYSSALLAFWVGIGLAVAPGPEGGLARWLAVAVAALFLLIELAWLTAPFFAE